MAHSPSKIRDVAAAIIKLVKPNEEEWQNKNAHHSFIRAEGSIDNTIDSLTCWNQLELMN